MSRTRSTAASAATLAVAAMTFTLSAPTVAAESKSPTDVTAGIVEKVAPNVGEISMPVQQGRAFTVDNGVDGDVSMPVSSEAGDVAVAAPEGDVTTSLPNEADTSDGVVATDGTIVYTGEEGQTDVAVQAVDDSVRIQTILNGPEAPTTYTYEWSVPADAEITTLESGAVFALNEEGSLIAGLAAPWAKDASGRDLPTHFEVSGSTVRQVIDTSEPGIQYPVVADPYLGIDLFAYVTRNQYMGYPRINANKSAWGQLNHSPDPGGITLFYTAGWNEVKAKQSIVTSRATYQSQYRCHVWGGFYNLLTGVWNLEGHRSNRTNWVDGVASHRCNW